MSTTKIIGKSKNFDKKCEVKNLIEYIENPEKAIAKGGQGILLDTPENIAVQFNAPRKRFHKRPNMQVRHIVIGFNDNEEKYFHSDDSSEEYSDELLKEFGYMVSEFFEDTQTYFAAHTDTDDLHMHMAVNNSNYRNGNVIHMTHNETYRFKQHIEQCLDKIKNPDKTFRPLKISEDNVTDILLDDTDVLINEDLVTLKNALSCNDD